MLISVNVWFTYTVVCSSLCQFKNLTILRGVKVGREARVAELPKRMPLIGVWPRLRLPSTQQLPPVRQEFFTRDGRPDNLSASS